MAAADDRAAFARAFASGHGRRCGGDRFVVFAARRALGGNRRCLSQCGDGGDYRFAARARATAKVNVWNQSYWPGSRLNQCLCNSEELIVQADRTATILMVEDDSMIRYLVAEYFRRVGYEVIEAPDGEVGLRSGLEKRADVIILDVMMPKMNGFDVCKQLREQNVSTPIIFLTRKDDERNMVAGLEGGAD